MMEKPSVPFIDKAGVYQVSDDDYLKDPVCVPSLNNTTAKAIVTTSPKHAWAMHPRLGGALTIDVERGTAAQDLGTVAHQMFLHGEHKVRILNVTDFKTKKAQEARDQAIAEGRIPLKADRYDAVRMVVEELEQFRAKTGAFTAGKPEQTLVWREGEHWSRCKVDWLPDDPAAYMWDLKTTSVGARAWARTAWDLGVDMQGTYYPRGSECVHGEPPAGMKFCVIETKPPFGLKVYELSPAALEVGDAQVHMALSAWANCRETGEWPGYSIETDWLDPPAWKLREWEEWTRTGKGLRKAQDERRVAAQMLSTGDFGG